MGILALRADERVANVTFSPDSLSVSLMDGRTISLPLAWYPKLLQATEEQRKNWKIAGAGYGFHWPDLDEDLSTEAYSAARRHLGDQRSSSGPFWNA
jgi:hypothetical protein